MDCIVQCPIVKLLVPRNQDVHILYCSGCSNGYRLYSGNCYKLIRTRRSFYDAYGDCMIYDLKHIYSPCLYTCILSIIILTSVNGTNIENK